MKVRLKGMVVALGQGMARALEGTAGDAFQGTAGACNLQ
jgi:hypothetical protein